MYCMDYKGQVLQVLQVFKHRYIKETPLEHRALHPYHLYSLLFAIIAEQELIFVLTATFTFSAFLSLNSSTKQQE